MQNMGDFEVPRRRPNWLARKLFWVTPPKRRERWAGERLGSSLHQAVEKHMHDSTRQLSRDRDSLKAMQIAPKSGKQSANWKEFVAHNKIVQLEGQLNQMEAIMHRMRCHELHLDGIIASQDAELKELRKRID